MKTSVNDYSISQTYGHKLKDKCSNNGRERSKIEKFMEKREWLPHPKLMEANKEKNKSVQNLQFIYHFILSKKYKKK